MHFFRSEVARFWIVGSVLTIIFGTIAVTVWLVIPEWRDYRAIQRVVSAAKKSDSDRVLDAIDRIAKLGIRRSSEDAILALLTDPDSKVRCYGAVSAVSLNLDRKRVKAALIKMLDADEDQTVRNTAAASLGALGADAADAIPSIMRELMKDPINPRDHRSSRSTVLALLDLQFAGVELPDPSLVPASPPMWFWIAPDPTSVV